VEKQYLKACVFAVYLVSRAIRGHVVLHHLTALSTKGPRRSLKVRLTLIPLLTCADIALPSLVEALTINFHYPELADTGIRIPQFDIEESIHNLKIGGSKGLGDSTDSARGPDGMKLRTVGEVKRAIKVRSPQTYWARS
jgi:hypothetical protein